jgi:ribonuclease Z
MPGPRAFQELRLVNGSTGDPALFVDDPGRDNALLIDCGENASLGDDRLGDLEAVFITHHHVDHFIGFDRIVRANIDRDKALHVYGPPGTIGKVYNRIKSYEYQFFPFQKIVLEVHEVLPDRLRVARLECAQRFPRPVVSEAPWLGPVVYQHDGFSVEAMFVDHTVPCLAFALVEEPDFIADPDRVAAGAIRAGRWVNDVRSLLKAAAPPNTPVATPISPGMILLADLKAQYFVETPGSRVAYVTDTAWSEQVQPALSRLAGGARRLYCDSFYAQAQIAQAEKHRHMTATQAAEFARMAGVGELVLIHFAARYKGRYDALVEEARAIFPNTSAEILPMINKKTERDANHS